MYFCSDTGNLYIDYKNEKNTLERKLVNKNSLDNKADFEHEHKYADSSSVGGPATSANKLNTNAGSATQPVYFANGIPVKTTYTLGASVPSGAKFTDTTYGAATSSTLGLVKVGSNITNSSGTISLTKANVTSALGYTPPTSDTNTTYSAGAGISLSGTTFSNSGVRSIATGSSNGTISVNTNGSTANVAVKGLGSAAYTNSNAYLAAKGQSAYDCNTCYDGGLYMIARGKNYPSGSPYGTLLVLPYRKNVGNTSPDFAVQIFIPDGDDSTKPNSMFYRTSLKDSWAHWNEVSTTSHTHDDRYFTESKLNSVLGSYETKDDASDKLATAKSYTDTKVSGLVSSSTVDSKISTHNTASGAHSDIRAALTSLTTKVTNFLDVDEETTDQLSEVLEMIEANKGTIESLTTSKVSVSDIANNLTTNSAGMVLSAAQGVYIQSLINGVDNELETHATDTSNPHGVTKAQVGLSKVDNTADASKPVSAAQAIAIADAKSAGTQAQTNLTAHINTKTNPHAVTCAQIGAVAKSGDTMTGTLRIKANVHGNWTEGIRINSADNGWTSLVLGGSSDSGTGQGVWSMHTYENNFYLAHNGSNNGSPMIHGIPNDGFSITGNMRVSNNLSVSGCTMTYDSANECLNFIF